MEYSREFLRTLNRLAEYKLALPRQAATRTQMLRGIIRETTALLEANLLDGEEVEEAANELALWLEQDPMLENEAHRVVRENLK